MVQYVIFFLFYFCSILFLFHMVLFISGCIYLISRCVRTRSVCCYVLKWTVKCQNSHSCICFLQRFQPNLTVQKGEIVVSILCQTEIESIYFFHNGNQDLFFCSHSLFLKENFPCHNKLCGKLRLLSPVLKRTSAHFSAFIR